MWPFQFYFQSPLISGGQDWHLTVPAQSYLRVKKYTAHPALFVRGEFENEIGCIDLSVLVMNR